MISRNFYLSFFVGLCFVYTRAIEEEQLCSTKAAEPCLAARKQKYSNALKSYEDGGTDPALQFEELGPQICLTQIRNDIDGHCFETNTELCPTDQARGLKLDWNTLNSNITELCEKVCPNFLQIATCKNLTVSSELKVSRFEKFCSSFNDSLICAKNALTDCEFGIAIYFAALEHQIMPYWLQICKSGCPNIDETVGVIKTCAKPLQGLGSKPDMDDLCRVHYGFKVCVFESPTICEEQVMTLIKFMYRKYYKVDFMCKTTTSTTTEATTTTTAATTMPSSSSSSSPSSSSFTPSSSSSSSSSSSITTMIGLDPSDIYSSCISEESIERMASEDQLHAATAFDLMQLEECIYKNLSSGDPSSTLSVSLYHIPPALWELFKSYKESGYQVIMEAIKERCHTAVPKGCEGHRYGLIECEQSGAAQNYTNTLLKILTLLILNSVVFPASLY